MPSESISSFANTLGGELFIGIGEVAGKTQRFWNGFARPEDANGLFQVIEKMTPLANHYNATFLGASGHPGYVLHLTIAKTRDILPANDGTVFVRRNAQNLRISGPDALERLRLDKGITSFEDEKVNTPPSVITNSVVAIEFMLAVVPTGDPDEWMRKQNLVLGDRPIVAGVLLYSEEPQAALPKRSAIKVYRYKTKDEEGSREQLAFDPITIEGCLYSQIEEAVKRTKALVEGIKTLGRPDLKMLSIQMKHYMRF